MNLGSMWASVRDDAYDSLGLDKETRDQLQPVVDQAKVLGASVFQTDGYVPPNVQGIGESIVFPSSLSFMNQKVLGFPAWMLVAAVIGLMVIVFLMRRK